MAKSFTDEELFDDAQFDSWNQVLKPVGRLQSLGRLDRGAPAVEPELIGPLYEVALELRDRLRFSQLRLYQLKSDIRQLQGVLAMERQHAAEELAEAKAQGQGQQRRVQEDLQQQLDRMQTTLQQTQEELRAERERGRDALAAQQARARQQLSTETQAAQEHAAAECQRALDALREVEAQLRDERAQHDKALSLERQSAAAKVAALDAQLRHLNKVVQDQATQIAAFERSGLQLEGQVAAAQQQSQATASQVRRAEERAEQADATRRALADEVRSLRMEVDEWRSRAEHTEGQHDEALEALLATKAELGELSHLQGLYLAAREELARLDKENTELKDMIHGQVFELTHSRILDTVSPRSYEKSTPLYMTPEMIGKSRPRSARRSARSVSPGRDGLLAATGVIYPPDVAASIERMAASLRKTPSPDGPTHVVEAAQLAQLAFLGPPSSAYPTDPDKFVFVRVAGGFSPKYVGSEPLPKASGWIPKDAVRLAQAFKHSHGITLDWRYWEPFLLMLNEVYHTSAGGRYHGGTYGSGAYAKAGGGGGTLRYKAGRPASARAAYGDEAETYERGALPGRGTGDVARQYLSRLASYPVVVQAERIVALRKELEKTRAGRGGGGGGVSAREQRERDDFIRTMAEKDYHILNELGEVVGENQRLRRSTQPY